MYKRLLTIILCVALCLFSFNISGCKNNKSFTVTFSGGHEDALLYHGDEVQVVENSSQIVEPIYVREGYNFIGWNLSISRIDKSTTVIAQWKKYDIEVVFYANGGKDGDGNRTIKITANSAKQLIDNQPQFKKKGYTLSWEPQLETITSSCQVNAVWTVNDYVATFKDKNGNNFKGNTLDITYNKAFYHNSICAPNVSGMKFAYWKDNNGVPFDNGMVWDIDDDVVLSAVYLPQEDYVIYYDLNGGNRQEGGNQRFFNQNQSINITNPTKKGYRFTGWQINGGGDKHFGSDITLEHFKQNGTFLDVTLKATWEPVPYTATLNLNGGQISGQKQIVFYYGRKIENLPVAQKANYEFVGWYFDDLEIKEGDVWEFAEDITLSAKFLAKYKVKFSLSAQDVNNVQVACRLVKWGDVKKADSLEDVEINLLEGQSLLSKGISIMPVVSPKEESKINEHIFGNYWKYVDSQGKDYKVLANTIFNSQNLPDINAGGTIVLVPYITLAWTPNY